MFCEQGDVFKHTEPVLRPRALCVKGSHADKENMQVGEEVEGLSDDGAGGFKERGMELGCWKVKTCGPISNVGCC